MRKKEGKEEERAKMKKEEDIQPERDLKQNGPWPLVTSKPERPLH